MVKDASQYWPLDFWGWRTKGPLERIRIHVDFYYDREKRTWVRPVSDSVITMTMIVKSGYFLYQDGDSVIDIRRYGYYIPGSNVKRIFFSDGYSEVLWDSPDMVALDSMRVLPYKLVEKISIENGDVHNRQKIKKLLKRLSSSGVLFCSNSSITQLL